MMIDFSPLKIKNKTNS